MFWPGSQKRVFYHTEKLESNQRVTVGWVPLCLICFLVLPREWQVSALFPSDLTAFVWYIELGSHRKYHTSHWVLLWYLLLHWFEGLPFFLLFGIPDSCVSYFPSAIDNLKDVVWVPTQLLWCSFFPFFPKPNWRQVNMNLTSMRVSATSAK
jgi:hypothetical protein